MTMQSCWLSPSGQVTYCGFAEHSKTADILLQKLKPELFDAYNMPVSLAYDPVAELEQLGYIRYCSWGSNPRWVVEDTTKCTKAQREAMFDLTGHWHEQ